MTRTAVCTPMSISPTVATPNAPRTGHRAPVAIHASRGPGRQACFVDGLSMPHVYETKLWRLQLPHTWRVREGDGDEDWVTFFRPDGVGILRVRTGDDFYGQSYAQWAHVHQPEEFQGKLSGRTCAGTYEDHVSRTWALSCRGQRLWVRYTCSAKNAELERLEVDEILQSICEAS
jgi:hypothetical protein